MVSVGYPISSAESQSSSIIEQKGVQAEIVKQTKSLREALLAQGIDEVMIAKKIGELLNAKTITKIVSDNDETSIISETPDSTAIDKGLKHAIAVRGDVITETRNTNVSVTIDIQGVEELKKLLPEVTTNIRQELENAIDHTAD